MNASEKLKLLYDRLSEMYHLGCIRGVLGWDERVYMPPKAAGARAQQNQYLSVLMHKKHTDPEFCALVDDLYEAIDSLSEPDKVNVRETKRSLDIDRKLPEDFVAEMSLASTISYTEWTKARPNNDFAAVQPHLEKLVGLCKRQSELLGYEEHPYDPLLDLYDPGSKTSVVKPLLMGLAEELRQLIPPITEKYSGRTQLQGQYPTEQQHRLCSRVAQDLGYSFETGRIDTSPHPFMTSLGPQDVRITTRYNESSFLPALYGTIHETGHALYDLGLPREHAGTPMGEPTSLSIHESQSRLWENPVGRSREFCTYLSRVLPGYLPEGSVPQDVEELWYHVNAVRPSLIRVEADEVTYSQHIVIRMLLEEALMRDELTVADLPGAWDDAYEKYLGVRPRDFKDGVMQDVHWYGGGIGYFPTYALGNLYNAMMMNSAQKAIPDLFRQIENGEFTALRDWTRENVHQHGKRYTGQQLIKHITGSELSAAPFVSYLKAKFLA